MPRKKQVKSEPVPLVPIAPVVLSSDGLPDSELNMPLGAWLERFRWTSAPSEDILEQYEWVSRVLGGCRVAPPGPQAVGLCLAAMDNPQWFRTEYSKLMQRSKDLEMEQSVRSRDRCERIVEGLEAVIEAAKEPST